MKFEREKGNGQDLSLKKVYNLSKIIIYLY